ncbi:hypothetical protein F5B20DRAFT_518647 [Whalleya microplaca]|nr:hypothetical protein F5B20DRAFT_518647 [Whalleya microplaca]
MSSIQTRDDQPRGNPTGFREVWWSVKNPPANPTDSFHGKTVLVTGANTGLGFQAALKYAALKTSHLILAVRSAEKGDAAKASILRETGCSSDSISVMVVDLSTFSSVQQFCETLNAQVPRLDVVLLNAGLCTPKFSSSPDGYEIALQVNVLSTALMALLLLPKLRETAATSASPPHLCFVNSIGYVDVQSDWLSEGETLVQRINNPSKFVDRTQYSLVKLAALFVMQGIAERCSGDANPIIINAACPRLCKTDLGRNFSFMSHVLTAPFHALFARTAEEGSRSLVSATTLGPDSVGKLWSNDEYTAPSKLLASDRGRELYHETWDEVLAILHKNVSSLSI